MPKQIPDVPSAPRAVGPYSVVTEANGFVFISGQIGLDPERGRIVDGGTAAQTRLIMENLESILADLGLTFDDVVKTTAFLVDLDDFAVFNEVYGEFVHGREPARSTVPIAALPLGARVEIEAIAARG